MKPSSWSTDQPLGRAKAHSTLSFIIHLLPRHFHIAFSVLVSCQHGISKAQKIGTRFLIASGSLNLR
jgi:hypothetical protein